MEVKVSLDHHLVRSGNSLCGSIGIRPSAHDDSSWSNWPSVGTLLVKVVGKALVAPKGEISLVTSKVVEMPGFMVSRGDQNSRTATFYSHRFNCVFPHKPLPPSYVGDHVKFIYYVEVELKNKEDRVLKVFKVPFIVIPQSKEETFAFDLDNDVEQVILESELECAFDGFTGDEFKPERSLSEVSHEPVNDEEVIDGFDPADLEALAEKYELNQHIIGEERIDDKPPVAFNISDKEGKSICSLNLQKGVFLLGDEVKGNFDFTKAQLKCYRLVISLERIETTKLTKTIKKIATKHLYSYHTQTHAFAMSIPHPQSNPSSIAISNFECELVSVQWNLRVKFILGKEEEGARWADAVQCPVVGNADAQVLEWNHPMDVFFPDFRPRLFNKSKRKVFIAPLPIHY